jgi:hypothetical protein
MPNVRAAGLLAGATVAATLGGCVGQGLSPEPPSGATLAGTWKLDHAASDDPQKVLDQMRVEAFKIIRRHQQLAANPPLRPGMRPGQEPTPDEDSSLATLGPDPLRRSPMAHVITSTMARGDFLTVRQSPGEFVLDYGTSRRSFTPGAHSVVSTEDGVGDQTSGWKGRDYVIRINGQLGPTVTESYGLSSDGHELIDKLQVGSGELPAVKLTRIYRPSTESAPQQLPSTE